MNPCRLLLVQNCQAESSDTLAVSGPHRDCRGVANTWCEIPIHTTHIKVQVLSLCQSDWSLVWTMKKGYLTPPPLLISVGCHISCFQTPKTDIAKQVPCWGKAALVLQYHMCCTNIHCYINHENTTATDIPKSLKKSKSDLFGFLLWGKLFT